MPKLQILFILVQKNANTICILLGILQTEQRLNDEYIEAVKVGCWSADEYSKGIFLIYIFVMLIPIALKSV